MRIFRRILVVGLLLLIGAATWLAIYAQNRGFTRTWREMVEAEFANRGVFVDIGRLTLGPFQGLVAENVRFFQDPQRRKELASVDNVILDLDLSDILNRDLSINTLDVQDDKMELPFDPGNQESEVLEMEQFSARLVVTDNQIEVVRAQAVVAGIEVSVKGSLFRPVDDPVEEDPEVLTEEAQLEAQKLQLLEIRRRLNRVERVLNQLEEFAVLGDETPRLDIDFAGDLDDLSHLYADIRFTASKVKRGNYLIESLQFSGEYQGERQRGILKELHLRDAVGDLRLRGDWPVNDRIVNFEFESTLDLQALIGAFWPNPRLGEVVFFSPPKVEAEGKVNLWQYGKVEWPFLPMDLIGTVNTERFASRGAVFDGMEMQFAIAGNRYYVRNLRLDHKSGVILANLIYDPRHPEEVFRFQSEMRLDPEVMLPFISSEVTKRFVSDWDFDDASAVYFAALGGGASLDPEEWKTRGVIDLRNFRRLGVPFEQLVTEYEAEGHLHTYRNLRVTRPEGELTVLALQHDAQGRWWQAEELRSTMDLYAGVRAVAPSLSEALESFRFTQAPEVILNGRIDSRMNSPEEESPEAAEAGGDSRHDFVLQFQSDQPASFEFLGRTLPLERPSGEVRASEGRLRLSEFSAELFGGTVSATFETDRVETDRRYAATIGLAEVSGDDLLRLYGRNGRTSDSDLNWSGNVALEGKLGEPESISAEGSGALDAEDLFALPGFADLGPLLQSQAEEPASPAGEELEKKQVARFDLGWKQGTLSVKNLDAEGEAWSLGGAGNLGLPGGALDFQLRASIEEEGARLSRRIEGSGTLEAPRWRRIEPKRPGS